MSTDAKDITRRFYEEVINLRNIHAIDHFCAADFVDHNPPPGTHKGEYMGVPGSGNPVEIGGIDILRMINGKAAERWGYFDDLKLMQQLGAMPGPKK